MSRQGEKAVPILYEEIYSGAGGGRYVSNEEVGIQAIFLVDRLEGPIEDSTSRTNFPGLQAHEREIENAG